jgi:type 1 glutamine amidotransferase
VVTPRVLLLIGQPEEPPPRQIHDQPEHWSALAALLRAAEVGPRLITDDLRELTPERLAGIDVLLNYSADGSLTDELTAGLVAAVEGGLGFVGLHAASAAFKTNEAYHGLVGSWFVTHPPIGPYRVEIVDRDHPVTRGVDDFEVVDERYEVRPAADDLRVLARADGHPQVYVREVGRGRVCYLAPGHDRRALEHPSYVRLVHQALAWAARRR